MLLEGNLVRENKQKRNRFDHAAPRRKHIFRFYLFIYLFYFGSKISFLKNENFRGLDLRRSLHTHRIACQPITARHLYFPFLIFLYTPWNSREIYQNWAGFTGPYHPYKREP